MRIFLSCQQSLQKHDVPAYDFWENYFKKGIQEAGHEWVEAQDVDWAEGLTYFNRSDLRKWCDQTWSQVIKSIQQQHKTQGIDLFLGYLFPKQVEPTAIQSIQALGIPCVNFFCDNVREFIHVPESFRCFDLHWVPEFKALKMYQSEKLNYVYAPMPVWVPPAQRTSNHCEKYGVSFIGSRDSQREILLAEVLNLGIELEIRGSAWIPNKKVRLEQQPDSQNPWQTCLNQWNFLKNQGPLAWMRKLQAKSLTKISDDVFARFVRSQPNSDEYVQILQQSMITLGINRYPSFHYPFEKPNTYSRMRDIEAPMMGACYLTEWTEGLDTLYELGEEIETYRTSEEMVEKIWELQGNSQKRRKMRNQAQKRVLSEHTIDKTLVKIFSSL